MIFAAYVRGWLEEGLLGSSNAVSWQPAETVSSITLRQIINVSQIQLRSRATGLPLQISRFPQGLSFTLSRRDVETWDLARQVLALSEVQLLFVAKETVPQVRDVGTLIIKHTDLISIKSSSRALCSTNGCPHTSSLIWRSHRG
jgi:hypothetical protein